jgi:hypothetical protein
LFTASSGLAPDFVTEVKQVFLGADPPLRNGRNITAGSETPPLAEQNDEHALFVKIVIALKKVMDALSFSLYRFRNPQSYKQGSISSLSF